MKKYYLYELKKAIPAIITSTVILSVLYTVILLTTVTDIPEDFYKIVPYDALLWLAAIIGGFAAAAIPNIVTEYKMTKRSADLYYALPLSHKHILLVKYLVGLTHLYILYTAVFWLGAFTTITRIFPVLNLHAYVGAYFSSLIPIYFIYSITSFVITRANTKKDRGMFLCFWTFIVPAAMLIVLAMTLAGKPNGAGLFGDYYYDGTYYQSTLYIYPWHYTAWAPLNLSIDYFQDILIKGKEIYPQPDTAELVNLIIGFSLTALMSIGSTIGLFMTEDRLKAENAEQISDSLFGYKTMIPAYSFILAFFAWETVFLVITVATLAYVVTVIYKRTLKVGWKSAIYIAAPMVVGIVAGIIVQAV